ncbi:MAG: ZIP family metal transporter [Patescibacteria group bacterium]
MLIIISLLACGITFLGGLFALKFRDKLHLILGFSAGAIVGVAFFDLLPEAIELVDGVYDISVITSMIALGFVGYMLVDRFAVGHSHADDHCENEQHRGHIGAGSLLVHNFLDGMAIGVAFQVSIEVGTVVAFAVLIHKFVDGLNVVSLILKNGGDRQSAFRWLFATALIPIFGIFATRVVSLGEASLGIILALFCGSFLYIGASDLLPESHHRHPTHFTTFATVLGMVVLYVAVKLAGI